VSSFEWTRASSNRAKSSFRTCPRSLLLNGRGPASGQIFLHSFRTSFGYSLASPSNVSCFPAWPSCSLLSVPFCVLVMMKDSRIRFLKICDEVTSRQII
jgi:hypothetical protein